MKKLLLVIVVLVIAAGAYAFLHLDSEAKDIIESAGSKALGVPVHVGIVKISLSARTATISSLTVDNPPGYKSPYLLKTKTIAVSLGDLSRQLVTIKSVLVEGMSVNYELGQNGPNLDAVEKNTTGAPAKESSGGSSSAPKLVITELKVVGATVSASVAGLQKNLAIPTITMNNIGSQSNPATAEQVASEVLPKIVNAASAEVLKGGLGSIGSLPTGTIGKGLKGLLGQ